MANQDSKPQVYKIEVIEPSPEGGTVYRDLILPGSLVNRLKLRQKQDGSSSIVSVYQDDRRAGVPPGDRCPNCSGPQGDGVLGVPTGEPCKPYFRGHGEYITRKTANGETQSYFQMIPLKRRIQWFPCPVCSMENFFHRLTENSGIVSDDEPWGSVDPNIYPLPGREQFESVILRNLNRWLQGDTTGWINIVGGYGVGKTAIGKAIVSQCILKYIDARYVLAETLLQMAYDSLGDFGADPQLELSPWLECSVLVLDELDWKNTRKASGDMTRSAEEVLTMLNRRYDRNKATVIISPLDWWQVGYDGTVKPNPEKGSDWKAVLSRARRGETALTQIEDQRESFGKAERGEE